jgi:hypothetical protein
MALRKRTSVFFDPDLVAGLKALKERDGTPEAEAIRRGIAENLAKRGIASGENASRHERSSVVASCAKITSRSSSGLAIAHRQRLARSSRRLELGGHSV